MLYPVVELEQFVQLPVADFHCHWYVSVPVPVAATVNVAVAPYATVLLLGWVVMVTDAAAVTVSVAAFDVVDTPLPSVTLQRY